MLVSIIIPVYNAQRYLEKLIDSLLNQTYSNIEIIFVNDGSVDSSNEIIKKYMRKDSRIILFNQENKGGASARNKGLQEAKGEYFYFVDADDYLQPNTVEVLVREAKTQNADIVVCNYRDVFPNGKVVREYHNKIMRNAINISLDPNLLNQKPALWNKLFTKNLFEKYNIVFVDVKIGQDFSTVIRLFAIAEKVVFINDILYNYVIHSNSISRSYDKRIEDVVSCCDVILNFYKKQNRYPKFKEELNCLLLKNILFQMTKVPLITNYEEKKIVYQSLLQKTNELYQELDDKKVLPTYYRIFKFIAQYKFIYLSCIMKVIMNLIHSSVAYKIIRKLDS